MKLASECEKSYPQPLWICREPHSPLERRDIHREYYILLDASQKQEPHGGECHGRMDIHEFSTFITHPHIPSPSRP